MSSSGLKVGDKVIVCADHYPWLNLGVVYGFKKGHTSRVLIRMIGVEASGRDGHAGTAHKKVDENLKDLPDLPPSTKGYWWVGDNVLKSIGSTL